MVALPGLTVQSDVRVQPKALGKKGGGEGEVCKLIASQLLRASSSRGSKFLMRRLHLIYRGCKGILVEVLGGY